MDIQLPQLDTRDLSENGVVVPLRDVTGAPALNPAGEPVTLTLLGADSSTYRKASRELARKRVERAQQGGRAVTDDALDQAEAENIELLVRVTVGFGGFVNSKGEPIKFSEEAVRFIYNSFPAIREQAETAINDRGRFIRRSSKT